MSVIIYYLLENVLPSAAAPSLEASAPLSHHSRIRRRAVGLSDPATNRSRTSGRRCRTGEDARSGYRRDTDSGERRRLRRAEPDRQQAGDPHPTALMFHVKHLYVYGHCREDGALACRRRGYFFPLRAEAMSPVKPWARGSAPPPCCRPPSRSRSRGSSCAAAAPGRPRGRHARPR